MAPDDDAAEDDPGAVGVDIDSAELRGSIDPQNLDAEAWFEYWPTAASPLSALATPVEEVEAGVGPQDLSAPIGGLAPDTEYSFRLAATNAHSPDPVHSATLTLRTDAPPAPPVVAFVDPGLPPPTAGVNVNLEPVAGTVRTKCPSDPDFVKLANPKQVPLDCLVDTSLGTVDLTAAKGIEAGTQSAFIWGGVFDVAQTPGHNYLTELSLVGRRKCEKKSVSEGARSSRVLARRRGAGRELWGSGKGNYSTSGSYGSATVRGTIWLVKDRCDNSTERLSHDLVPVDFPAGEDVIVQGTAGDRFFLIDRGEVEVFESGVFRRNEGIGESFGEIALLHDVPRTATVRTTAETRLLALEREQFLGAVTGHRRSHQLAHTVVDSRWPRSGATAPAVD